MAAPDNAPHEEASNLESLRPHQESSDDEQLQRDTLLKEIGALGFPDMTLEKIVDLDIDMTGDQSTVSQLLDVQRRVAEYVGKDPKQALTVEEQVVREMNQKHAVVHTDRFYILTEKPDPNYGGINFTLESKQSFKDTYENQVVVLESSTPASKATVWLRSPQRRQYDGIIFYPDHQSSDPRYYNMWRGFAIEPKQGNCSLYKAHVRDVICDGNSDLFRYVWKWVARLVQSPHLLAETAIVLMGEQGTGKNTFVNPLGEILGPHYMPLDNIQQLLGHFNFHLKNAVLIHGNEALWGGNRKEGGRLKAYITEKHKLIEGKGKDCVVVPNFSHLIVSTNEDWPVHMDRDDRRFLILRVSNRYKQDKDHFKAINHELQHGGIQALLHELLSEDLSDFDPRIIPHTADAFDIKLLSADSCERYVYAALYAGNFDVGNATPEEEWPTQKAKTSVFADYGAWCDREGLPQKSSQELGKALKRLVPSIESKRPRDNEGRFNAYVFPSLQKSRLDFEKVYQANKSIWD